MLYHRFTIISLFALGSVFLSLLLMHENHANRAGHRTQILSHSFLQTFQQSGTSRPATTTTPPPPPQEKELP